MKIIQSIRYSINSILDIYQSNSKNKFQFFFTFSILSNLTAFILTNMLGMISYLLFNPNKNASDFFGMNDFFYNSFDLLYVFLLMNMILLLVYFNRQKEVKKIHSFKISDLFSVEMKNKLLTFTGLFFFNFVIIGMFFNKIYLLKDNSDSLSILNEMLVSKPQAYYLNKWLMDILSLFKYLIPIVSIVLFSLYLRNDKINWKIIVEHRFKILASFVLFFTFDKLLVIVNGSVSNYLLNLVKAPFVAPEIPWIISVIVSSLVYSFMIIPIIGALYFPFEEIEKKNGVIQINEGDLLDF